MYDRWIVRLTKTEKNSRADRYSQDARCTHTHTGTYTPNLNTIIVSDPSPKASVSSIELLTYRTVVSTPGPEEFYASPTPFSPLCPPLSSHAGKRKRRAVTDPLTWSGLRSSIENPDLYRYISIDLGQMYRPFQYRALLPAEIADDCRPELSRGSLLYCCGLFASPTGVPC
ncbi:hypothetical protein RRG08_031882 [Elysia crispata]|uniref:Uncharacterized protein n=1 Tax=Elysia crispata TaxID=231223 RepID=A0AAE1DYF3_9GAST|nr:hypothetical protein RRG08_031882 [Elysia crispata]